MTGLNDRCHGVCNESPGPVCKKALNLIKKNNNDNNSKDLDEGNLTVCPRSYITDISGNLTHGTQ